MLIDIHAHLNDEKYENIDEIIKISKENNLEKIIVSGYDKLSSLKAIELADKYDIIYASIGFHPCDVKGLTTNDYDWLNEAAKHKKVVAIGEIGFDFHWDKTTKEEQLEAFIKQMKIAEENNLPIVVHSRDALQITFDTIKKYANKNIGGVIHSFSGSLELAKEYIKMNFYISVSGTVTFKNAVTIKEVVKGIDKEYLLSETDCPYLTPHPYRGKINYPHYVEYVVNEMSILRNEEKFELLEQIEKNVKKVFKV